MMIKIILNNQTDFELTKEYEACFEQCAKEVFAEGEACYEIGLNILNEEEIRQLNRAYRGVDKSTDVLSFLLEDEDLAQTEGYIYLGDVMLCAQKAQQQAMQYGHGLLREMMYLFVHALLHLKGYDHMAEEEKAQMRAEEEKIMKSMGLERSQVEDEK